MKIREASLGVIRHTNDQFIIHVTVREDGAIVNDYVTPLYSSDECSAFLASWRHATEAYGQPKPVVIYRKNKIEAEKSILRSMLGISNPPV